MLSRIPKTTHPLLYWTTLIYLIGMPNFIKFDQSGRTSDMINFTSVSGIVLCFLAGYLLVLGLLLEKKPLLARKVRADLGLWMFLLAELVLASLLEPRSRLTTPSVASSLITIFRFGQWIVCFGLVLALYSRTPREHANKLMGQLMGRISWIWIGIVYFCLPIVPSQVYGLSAESTDAAGRLGGELIGPAQLALFASIAFFYALLLFPTGLRKVLACLLALATLFLTRARAPQAFFLVAAVVYLLILSKKSVLRWITLSAGLLLVVIALPFADRITKSISRGQSAQTLMTLDDRTRVWSASWDAIKVRPFIGYGYAQGARHALRDHWTFKHWIPPHAHNEFLEIWLAGGVPALLLTIFIYGRVFLLHEGNIRAGHINCFFFFR